MPENTPINKASATGLSKASGTGRNFIFFITLMVGLSAFGSFVNDMYTPTFPELTRALHTSAAVVQLGLTMGMAGLAVGQFVMGPISDRVGRKPVMLLSLLLFVVGAVAAIHSTTIHFFLGSRFVQGLGAAGGYFLARTIPADIYGGRPLAKAMALIGAINGFAPASAPVIGGFVASAWGWKGVFVILAIFALVLFVTALFFKESLPRDRRATGFLGAAFAEYPKLLRNRKFMTHVLLKGAALGMLFAYISAAPFIFQTHYGYTETTFGLFIGFNALFTAAGAMIALKFKYLKDAAWVGGWMLLITTAITSSVLWFVDDFWAFEISLLPMIFSMGLIFTAGNTLAMNEGRQYAGTASAILGIVGYIFGATVAPLVGLGNIMHSTAIALLSLAVITFVFAMASRRLAPDLDNPA